MSKYNSYNAVIKRGNSNFYVVTYSYFLHQNNEISVIIMKLYGQLNLYSFINCTIKSLLLICYRRCIEIFSGVQHDFFARISLHPTC